MLPPLVLITGSSDGIGRETACALAERGARVILHGRDPERLLAAAHEVDKRSGTWPAGQELADLSSLAEVRALAARVLDHHPRIDVLVNNAGVFMPERQLTADGFEATYAINHLAPLLLTHLLLPALREGPQGRVLAVSSGAHLSARFDWGDNARVLGVLDRTGYDPHQAYARSKLGNVLFAVELGRRLRGSGVTVNALHPGVVSTRLLRAGFGGHGTDSLQEAAATSVHLALAPEMKDATAGYYARKTPSRMHPVASERAITTRFYQEGCTLVGVAPVADGFRERG